MQPSVIWQSVIAILEDFGVQCVTNASAARDKGHDSVNLRGSRPAATRPMHHGRDRDHAGTPASRWWVLIPWAAALTSLACSDTSDRPSVELRTARVTNTIALQATALVRIRTAGGTIVTTPEHPFARPDGAWTPAGELAAGNLIVSASTAEGVRIENVTTVPAPPTRVYNLSVASGRAYFVGVERLLVHNKNCHRPGEPIQVNDMPEFDGHCGFCTLAALADMSVAELTDTRDIIPDNDGVSPTEFRRLLRQTGAITEDTRATIWRQPKSGRATKTIPEALEEFIRDEHDSSTNTFALLYARPSRIERPSGSGHYVTEMEGHTITAVRLEDGSVVYMDFQERPPRISRAFNPDIVSLAVWPTTTDYRYNRHMLSALRHGQRAPIIL